MPERLKGGSIPANKGEAGREEFHELCYYTLAHPDPSFIHQHAVDAFTAQKADKDTKPIALAFALIGLYLYVELGYSGKEVQAVHMRLAEKRKPWRVFDLPEKRGDLTVSDVLAAPAGPERDEVIREWCACVWAAYGKNRNAVVRLIESERARLSRR